MKDLVIQWLNSGNEKISFFEDIDEIRLKRQGDTVLLHVQLVLAQPGNTHLQHWLRLGAASLNHFQGALALEPNSGALWLVQQLRTEDGVEHLLRYLGALLNQRDAWRATAARLARPVQNLKPTSLRSLSF